MSTLLDTHAFIWFLNGDSEMSEKLKAIIADGSNKCYLSIASIWEIAIKISINKLRIKGEFNQITEFLAENDIAILPINFGHILRLIQLPYHHRDPFDRIIAAQALTESMSVGTKDNIIEKYGVKVIW
jgi:PIN domain nuclease of toxin-antitoxin system